MLSLSTANIIISSQISPRDFSENSSSRIRSTRLNWSGLVATCCGRVIIISGFALIQMFGTEWTGIEGALRGPCEPKTFVLKLMSSVQLEFKNMKFDIEVRLTT